MNVDGVLRIVVRTAATAATVGVAALLTWGIWAAFQNHARSAAFDLVAAGQGRDQVVHRLGPADHAELQGTGVSAYANGPCSAPCHERLWWENVLLPRGFEAWSVELDQDGRVLRKAHWVSP